MFTKFRLMTALFSPCFTQNNYLEELGGYVLSVQKEDGGKSCYNVTIQFNDSRKQKIVFVKTID